MTWTGPNNKQPFGLGFIYIEVKTSTFSQSGIYGIECNSYARGLVPLNTSKRIHNPIVLKLSGYFNLLTFLAINLYTPYIFTYQK